MSPELLRAWERRYGLLDPTRSQGGFRLFSARDEERVGLMKGYLAEGYSAAEAAALVRQEAEARPAKGTSDVRLPDLARQLRMSLEAFDGVRSDQLIDQMLTAYSAETLLADVFLPYLHELGDRWERGEVTIAQEHFASNVLRSRLLSLGRGWGRGPGRQAVLCCAPGELHDIGLIAFGLALGARGWGITYLGADTPVEQMRSAADELMAALTVVAAVTQDRFAAAEKDLRRLAETATVAIGGAGANREVAIGLRARLLMEDPIEAAQELAAFDGLRDSRRGGSRRRR